MTTRDSHRALVIPVYGDVYEIQVGDSGSSLTTLQEAVGGFIEAVPIPEFVKDAHRATAYVNEEGKYTCLWQDGSPQVNWRATDFMVPGIGLQPGDYIVGPLVLTGFDPQTGSTAKLPDSVERRVKLIVREAGPGRPPTPAQQG